MDSCGTSCGCSRGVSEGRRWTSGCCLVADSAGFSVADSAGFSMGAPGDTASTPLSAGDCSGSGDSCLSPFELNGACPVSVRLSSTSDMPDLDLTERSSAAASSVPLTGTCWDSVEGIGRFGEASRTACVRWRGGEATRRLLFVPSSASSPTRFCAPDGRSIEPGTTDVSR